MKGAIQRIISLWRSWVAKPQFWETVPFAIIGLTALLLMVKGCQGIVYHSSTEYRLRRLGYGIDEARAMAQSLTAEQADTLLALQCYDDSIYPIVSNRYFIAKNFKRYLTCHCADSSLAVSDVIAIVNVGADRGWYSNIEPSDTTDGYYMLINKSHYLGKDYRPSDMVNFDSKCSYRGNQAAKVVVESFVKMQQDCKKLTNSQLMVNSSYRPAEAQEQIYSTNKEKERTVARAGYSEHQTGLSIDVTSIEHPKRWAFDKSEEGIWMRENCYKYGFILRYPKGKERITGYEYEPWHLRYVGIQTARVIHNEGITLEEYHAYYIEPHTKPQSKIRH